MNRKIYLYARLLLLGLLAGYVVHLGIQRYQETGKLNTCALVLQARLSPQYNPRVVECKRLTLKGVRPVVACSFTNDTGEGSGERETRFTVLPRGVCD